MVLKLIQQAKIHVNRDVSVLVARPVLDICKAERPRGGSWGPVYPPNFGCLGGNWTSSTHAIFHQLRQ